MLYALRAEIFPRRASAKNEVARLQIVAIKSRLFILLRKKKVCGDTLRQYYVR